MGFARTKSDYDYQGEFQENSLMTIETAERRLKDKKRAVEDIQNEFKLLEVDAFEKYKSNIHYLRLDQKALIKDCRTWINMLEKKQDKDGNKLDGRKNYTEKNMYDYYIDTVKEYLGIDSMDDVSFNDYNYGEATYIYFNYLSHRWILEIPHVDVIRLKSYQRYGGDIFRIRITHQRVGNSSFYEFVGATFDEEQLKDIMSKGVEKYVNNTESEK